MNPPAFSDEIPIDSLRPGDTVHFLSDLGGFRFGTVVSLPKKGGKPLVTIRPNGRKRSESVTYPKIRAAFRDTFQEKDKLDA